MIASLAVLAIALLVLNAIGSGLARLAGGALVFGSLIWLSSDSADPVSAGWYLLTGAGLWLFGHWLWALKHRAWRTMLARRVFALPGLHAVAPIESRDPANRRREWPTAAEPSPRY